MNEKKFRELIESVNHSFHRIWFKSLLYRPGDHSEILKGLSFMEIHVICMVYKHPDVILKDIRDFLKIPQTTLSSMISKLEKKGLIERVINRKDMRSFSIKITEKGEEVFLEHKRFDFELARRVLESLDESERENFAVMMEKIIKEF